MRTSWISWILFWILFKHFSIACFFSKNLEISRLKIIRDKLLLSWRFYISSNWSFLNFTYSSKKQWRFFALNDFNSRIISNWSTHKGTLILSIINILMSCEKNQINVELVSKRWENELAMNTSVLFDISSRLKHEIIELDNVNYIRKWWNIFVAFRRYWRKNSFYVHI